MHSSGSMTRKFGPSRKQSTGQTSTQSPYLQLIQFSVTTKVMVLGLYWVCNAGIIRYSGAFDNDSRLSGDGLLVKYHLF